MRFGFVKDKFYWEWNFKIFKNYIFYLEIIKVGDFRFVNEN